MIKYRTIHIKPELLSEPVDGEVLVNKYWAVYPEKGLAFWQRRLLGRYDLDRLSPQCNSNKNVSEQIARMRPEHHVEKIPAVYIGHIQSVMEKRGDK